MTMLGREDTAPRSPYGQHYYLVNMYAFWMMPGRHCAIMTTMSYIRSCIDA